MHRPPLTAGPAGADVVRRPRVGVSACLLGRQVRHDGGHKRSRFLCEALDPHVEWVPVCPEVEAGLSVPRESMRLVGGDAAGTRLVGSRSGHDHTDRLERWADARLDELARLDLDGYVLAKDSPSCGIERVRLYRPGGGAPPLRRATGLFAAMLRARLPALPLCEDGWLHDDGRAESFLVRIFTHRRIRSLIAAPARAALVDFHARHKYLTLAHSPVAYRALGRMVARAAELSIAAAVNIYSWRLLDALSVPATRGTHANVLEHILGHFKRALPATDRREVALLIAEYRAGVHQLAVPLALLSHHLRQRELGGWLAGQVYFEPYPRALGRPPAPPFSPPRRPPSRPGPPRPSQKGSSASSSRPEDVAFGLET